jgi:hypothetical protein
MQVLEQALVAGNGNLILILDGGHWVTACFHLPSLVPARVARMPLLL